MTEWISPLLDVVLIGVVSIGVVQAMRLIRQLRDLRAGRTEMERFVRDFNGAVIRAEAGIKALRSAARESGDDLEKLVEKAVMVRDELNFIVESADGVAERLSSAAADVLHTDPVPKTAAGLEKISPAVAKTDGSVSAHTPGARPTSSPTSRAEQELLQALKKLS